MTRHPDRIPLGRLRRNLGRFGAAGAAAGLLLIGTASSAWAHLDVEGEGTAGQITVLTFRVPNESPTAKTIDLEIQLPTDTPLAVVQFEQTAGWTASMRTATLPTPVTQNHMNMTRAVISVTFRADTGGGLGPGSFGLFRLTVGPLPDIKQLTFPTIQTYNNGDVVNWNQPETPNGDEPEYPVPTFTLGSAGSAAGDHAPTVTVTAQPSTANTGNSTALVIAIAILLAALALLVASTLWRRPRRTTARTAPETTTKADR